MSASDGAATAVVLMAYGTPSGPEQILPYYLDIRRGRPPTDEQLADLTRRYEAIGGVSPLTERTNAQRAALVDALAATSAPSDVFLGFKHVAPSIEDAVAAAIASGAERLVGLVLAPHHSSASVGEYHRRLRAAAGSVAVDTVDSWATEPAFVEFIAADLRRQLATMPDGSIVVFTAHSLPQRVIDGGDPYVDEVTATARAVAGAVGLANDAWTVGWQSAGRTPEPWLGPDILAMIDDCADRGVPGVIVAAVGFVADHLEVLYDLDIEAAGRAAARGLAFRRTACVNADPSVFAGLSARIAALS